MPLPFDPTDPVMAAFHACFVQGGYSTPAIEAGRMKTDVQRATNRQLIAWAEQASVPLPTDGSREDLQRRLCDRIDARLAAYEQEGEPVMTGPPNYAAHHVEAFLRDRLREVLGEEDAAEVVAEVDDYSNQISLVRVDNARLHLYDESDDTDPDYWAAVVPDEDRRKAEGPLAAVMEDLRGWITGE